MLRSLTARASTASVLALVALAAGAGGASAKKGDSPGGAQPGNPPGNNGTVKVDRAPFDDHRDNEPHVGCVFEVDFYNFDQGDLWADVSFDLHAPTGSGRLTVSPARVFIGQDPAGGHDDGDDLDASQIYDLSDALAASGAQPHPKQGYHVKLTVHADGSQGSDVKHKVFWIEPCAGVAPDEVSGETDGVGSETGGTGGGAGAAVPLPSSAASGSAVRGDESKVLGETFERALEPVAPSTQVLGAQSSRGSLARTGAEINTAVAAALALLVVGLGLRRTAASASG